MQRAVGPQIADLYGTMLRSLPVFFLQDDHDYFEGDAAADFVVSFPPEPFMLELGRATQHLYYPEFLPDAGRPLGLAGTGRPIARRERAKRSGRCAAASCSSSCCGTAAAT